MSLQYNPSDQPDCASGFDFKFWAKIYSLELEGLKRLF